ncbi:hypothetical protein PRIC1_005493 [Phytophthora ramorum]
MTVSDDGRVESVGLVNTKALEIAGVDVAGKGHEVKHGAIDVDEKGATGILREDAVQIVEQHANEPSLELRIFSDGSLGAETAALRASYKGTDNKGILMNSDEDLLKKIRDADNAGYRVEIHAIGDRAAEQAKT